MDTSTAERLCAITRDLYVRAASSFSDTRASAWPGWQRILQACRFHDDASTTPHHVLDIGCGNLRFERFLAEAVPDASFDCSCVDACAPLAQQHAHPMPPNARIRFHQIDVLSALAHDAANMPASSPTPLFDLSVAFGFMHHIPVPMWRGRLLQALVDRTREGGIIAVSFWQFLHDDRLAAKAAEATQRGCARYDIAFDDAHDRLLGWQDRPDLFRYCHHFDNAEIDRLIASLSGTRTIDRFNADGRGMLNHYVVLQRTGHSATSVR